MNQFRKIGLGGGMDNDRAGMIRLSIECDAIAAKALWDAAASRAADDFAMEAQDVAETIGPRDDPDIAACMTMLLDGVARAGVVASIAIVMPEKARAARDGHSSIVTNLLPVPVRRETQSPDRRLRHAIHTV